MENMINQCILYILVIGILHMISISFEIIYRKICYPLDYYGFFFSIFSTTSDACGYLRSAPNGINRVVVHASTSLLTHIIQTIMKTYTKINN